MRVEIIKRYGLTLTSFPQSRSSLRLCANTSAFSQFVTFVCVNVGVNVGVGVGYFVTRTGDEER